MTDKTPKEKQKIGKTIVKRIIIVLSVLVLAILLVLYQIGYEG